MGRGAAAKRPAAAASSNRTLRGLIVNQKYASRFVTDGKTWEFKHTFARCVKEGQDFFLVESGIGHNQFGVAVFRILAKLQFTRQQHVSWSDLKSKHKFQHCCADQKTGFLAQELEESICPTSCSSCRGAVSAYVHSVLWAGHDMDMHMDMSL